MEIHLVCVHCGKKLAAPADRAGKRGRCPACHQTFIVPPAARPTAQRLFPVMAKTDDQDLIDMTAMVDIVFFLLIFFMVTSMHSLQASIALPTPEADRGTRRGAQSASAEDDQVVVHVDADDTVAVDDEEVPSRQELIARLRSSESTNLLVLASGEASHGAVVMVLDAGSDAGMEQIRLVSEGLEGE